MIITPRSSVVSSSSCGSFLSVSASYSSVLAARAKIFVFVASNSSFEISRLSKVLYLILPPLLTMPFLR